MYMGMSTNLDTWHASRATEEADEGGQFGYMRHNVVL